MCELYLQEITETHATRSRGANEVTSATVSRITERSHLDKKYNVYFSINYIIISLSQNTVLY